jgi:hypothetical protein
MNHSENVLKHTLRTFFFASILMHLLCSARAEAQFIDSIKTSLKARPSLYATLDSRNTFIGSRRAEITGLRAGLRFKQKFRVGVGFHFLSTPQYRSFNIANDSFVGTKELPLKVRYVALSSDYLFYKTKRWELMVAAQMGIGRSFYGPEPYSSIVRNDSYFLVYEPMISAEYSVLKWLGVSGKYGYRVSFGAERLTAPIYAFGVDIYWFTIYRSIRSWAKNKRSK